MFQIRMIGQIVKDAGLVHLSVAFVALYAICAVAVYLADPGITAMGDAAWLCYQAISTIGFGDIKITSTAARLATVVLSLASIFYLAVLTGAVVRYCTDIATARRNGNLMHFMDQLEHVDQLSHSELTALARQVRAFRKSNGAGATDSPAAASPAATPSQHR